LTAEVVAKQDEELKVEEKLVQCFKKERNRWCGKIVTCRLQEEVLKKQLN